LNKAGKVRFLLIISAFAGSAVLLTVIQAPVGAAALAWVSLVPFILACSPQVRPRHLAAAAYFVSLCYWLGNLYWMAPVTWLGWATLCAYMAFLWPLLALCLRYCRTKKVPLFIAAPILFVGAERLQGVFLGGFFWRFLAHSQYANITIIQIADIFGAAGVSFLVAMVNGLVAELLIAAQRRILFARTNLLKIAVVGSAVFLAAVYGLWRIAQTEQFLHTGPMVGALQSNVPQFVKDSGLTESDRQIFNDLLEKNDACAKAGAQLVVWPETMVPGILDDRILRILSDSTSHKLLDRCLKDHAAGRSHILVGASGGEPLVGDDGKIDFARRYNSAFLYTPDGAQADRQYNKIHLVPFGEVVPCKKSAPWLHGLMMKFTPYDYDYTLDYGTEYTVFEIADGKGPDYNFGVLICYEDAVPYIARRFALDERGAKRLDWLVNISNDGWFVRFEDGRVFPSAELAEHTAVCVFRAVENRLAVVRSVNTGISCLIDTVGRVKNAFLAGTLPEKAMERKGVAGWFVDKVPIDKRVTLFSRYGQWLDFCCAAGFVGCIIIPPLGRFVRKRKVEGPEK